MGFLYRPTWNVHVPSHLVKVTMKASANCRPMDSFSDTHIVRVSLYS